MRILFGAIVVCALLFPTLAGCGSGGRSLPELVPVTGTVTLDGEPISDLGVTFLPVGSTGGTGSSGVTDASGTYELKSEGQTGAPVGEYTVICSKFVTEDGSLFVSGPDGLSPIEADAKELIPPQYSQVDLTELKATVPAGGGTIDFKLASGE